jgi:hydrogenase maturation factor
VTLHGPGLVPLCDHTVGCITCGDEAVPLSVLVVEDDGLALCADAEGNSQTVETALVGEVAVGEQLLVHAGTALARAAA